MTALLKRMEQFLIRNDRDLGNLMFYVALAMFIPLLIFGQSFLIHGVGGNHILIVINISMALLIFKELLMHQLDWRSLGGLLAIMVMSELFWHADERWSIPVLIFLFSARTVSWKVAGRVAAAAATLSTALVILSALIGWTPNYCLPIGGRDRWTLGFNYVLVAPTIFLGVTMVWICLKKNRISWWELLSLTVLNVALFAATKSRLPFFIVMLALLSAVVLKIWPDLLKNHRWIKWILIWSFVAFALFSIFASVGYLHNAGWAVALNSHLDHRIMLAARALKKAGFTLLGYDYHMVGNGINYEGVADAVTEGKYTYIDNLYMQTLVRRGMLFLVLFLAATTWLMRKLMDREPQGYLIIMLSLLALQAVIQDNFFQLCYNPLLLLYGMVLMRGPEEDEWESPMLERLRARRRGRTTTASSSETRRKKGSLYEASFFCCNSRAAPSRSPRTMPATPRSKTNRRTRKMKTFQACPGFSPCSLPPGSANSMRQSSEWMHRMRMVCRPTQASAFVKGPSRQSSLHSPMTTMLPATAPGHAANGKMP